MTARIWLKWSQKRSNLLTGRVSLNTISPNRLICMYPHHLFMSMLYLSDYKFLSSLLTLWYHRLNLLFPLSFHCYYITFKFELTLKQHENHFYNEFMYMSCGWACGLNSVHAPDSIMTAPWARGLKFVRISEYHHLQNHQKQILIQISFTLLLNIMILHELGVVLIVIVIINAKLVTAVVIVSDRQWKCLFCFCYIK